MSVYIVGFLISIFLIYYAEGKRFSGSSSRISVVIALLIPCLIAGLRDVSIGTDVQVYIEPTFEIAKSSESFFEFFSSEFFNPTHGAYAQLSGFEFGYLVLSYLITKCFGSIHALLFAIQALTVVPIYKGLRAFERTQPVWLGMTVYYFLYFNHSLNMMRQWMAMALLFYGYQFLVSNQYRKYFAVILGALLLHYSAVLGVIIYITYETVAKEKIRNIKLRVFLLLAIGLCAILSLELLVNIMNRMGLRYGSYIDGTLKFMPNQLLYRLPLVVLFILRVHSLRQRNQNADFFVVMIAYDILASQLTSIFSNSGRIALYFGEYCMLSYPAVCMASNYKDNRKLMRMAVIMYLCVYWWYSYAYLGMSETVPYVSVCDW